MKVLVVDDSRVMRKIISRNLHSIGIADVQEACDGDAAWQLFGSQPFDMVITDWSMPKLNGLEFAKQIRASGSDVPIIMVTTEAEQKKISLVLDAGVTDYLCKPFEPAELRQRIDKFVPA